ncbi:hypothetical protein PROFUN_10562 [Planoprotostelium fungivorum]|uniref:Uncharacterized protein n=1 Tax=Planoprotostelium fungivorum TaxID=1890364 RepID=A0A2P6N6T0_9EUKA|nr:hypothetical protein PROFUN_10562 [Planoprotostelium fungivorum]
MITLCVDFVKIFDFDSRDAFHSKIWSLEIGWKAETRDGDASEDAQPLRLPLWKLRRRTMDLCKGEVLLRFLMVTSNIRLDGGCLLGGEDDFCPAAK